MPPRRNRQPPPPEPVIEIMEVDGSGEDMDVSEDEVPVEEDGASSEPGRDEAASEEESNGEGIDAEDDEQDRLAEDEDDEDQEDELSSSPSRSPPPKTAKAKSTPTKPRLKIKLKFSGVAPSNATPTPSDEMPLRPAGRKGHPKHVDVESEDDDDDAASTRSTSYMGPTRMTHRQAALAGMVESSEHVVLEETVSKKKKHLNETELALKREETARKRKNLSVKKLEDEKTETINRLLKKQSRSRGKKAALAAAEADEDEQDAEDTSVSVPPQVTPTLFRWVSSSKSDSLPLSFSIPPSLLLPNPDSLQRTPPTAWPSEFKPTSMCAVSGCTLPRKYRLVNDPTMGGCGMEHLKALQPS